MQVKRYGGIFIFTEKMEKGKTVGANKVNEHKGSEIGMEKWPAIGFLLL